MVLVGPVVRHALAMLPLGLPQCVSEVRFGVTDNSIALRGRDRRGHLMRPLDGEDRINPPGWERVDLEQVGLAIGVEDDVDSEQVEARLQRRRASGRATRGRVGGRVGWVSG